ncbi:MAG: MerR family transcriptional regulator [Elusimicrobia bacterium]|nr:MerR family transcriptional regulator [Elusimicrobiota bacterium]
MKNEKKYYSLAEVCEILQISRNTLYNWETAGKIPKPKRDPMNNYRIFEKQDIDKLRQITAR